jgi:hypothetical protein
MKEDDKCLVTKPERVEQSIQTWMSAYNVTLKTDRAFKKRLEELNSWDDCNGNSYEHNVKTQALQRLIS